MKNIFLKTVILLVVICLNNYVVIGQITDSLLQDTHTLADVEVMASKEKQDIFKLSVCSTQIKSESIKQQNLQSTRALSALVPNLFMPDYGSKLTAPIYIRGIGSRINSPSVGLYVDGVPYFEKAAFDFEWFDIESIEVLSGPQATLYGRNTMGGIINVHSRLPQAQRFTHISVNAGNYDNYSLGAQHHQPISKTVQMSVGAMWKKGHYQLKNSYDDSFVDRQENALGRMRWLFTPSKRWRFLITLQYDQSTQKGYPYALYNDKNNSIQVINYNQESYYNRQLLSNSFRSTYSFEKCVLEVVTAQQYLSDDQSLDQDFMPLDMFVAQQEQKMNVLSQEVYLKSKPNQNSNYEWLSGVFAFHQQLDKAVNVHYGSDAVSLLQLPAQIYYFKNFQNTNTAWALFHQSTFHNLLLKGLSWNVGIRIDKEYSRLDFAKHSYLTATQQQIKENSFYSPLDFSQWVPKVSISYRLSPLSHTYFAVAKGYKTGGFNTSFVRESDRTYDPEYSWNYEWGIKAKLWHQRLHTALSLFYIDWRNQQVYQPVYDSQGHIQPGSLLQNAAKARSQGAEVSIIAFVSPRWQFNSRFGYTDAIYLKYSKKQDKYDGNRLPYIPVYTFYLDARYHTNINKPYLKALNATMSYSGFGKHYWREDNIAYQNYYGLLNFNIVLQQKQWQMTLWVKNLLNTNYNAFYFKAIGHSYAQEGRPLMLGIKLGFDF